MIILGTNSIKDTGYDVANSCRFNDGDSASMHKTPGSAGNRRKFTFSCWIKKGDIAPGDDTVLFSGDNSGDDSRPDDIRIRDTGKLYVSFRNTGDGIVSTQRVLRDPSAWMNIVVAVDTEQGTAANRVKIYINGVQESALEGDGSGSPTYPSQDHDCTGFGRDTKITVGARSKDTPDKFFDGYMAEVCYVDGSQLAPTSFGEFDEDSGIWKPIDVSGLTFGTNGFYLDFEDSSALGNDKAGSNNFTVNNLTAIDQSTDTCTNNFATMNPLDNYFAGSTFSEGNLKIVTTGGNITYNTSTIGFSSGKWYMETKLAGSSGYTVGVVRGVATANDNGNKLGNRADGWSYDDGGDVEHNGGSLGGSFASYSSGNIIGIYADLDNNKLYFSKDGSLQNSGTGLTLTAGTYFFAVGDNNASNSSTYEVNFGSPSFAISSGNTDGTYGNFEYSTTITGDSASKTFKALNTKNLAEYG
jgi:hypothetical protein